MRQLRVYRTGTSQNIHDTGDIPPKENWGEGEECSCGILIIPEPGYIGR